MKKQNCAISELEEHKSIACYGIGRDFYSFFEMPYAAKILEHVSVCVDMNFNRSISVQGKTLYIKNLNDSIEEIRQCSLLLITSSDYSEQILEKLNDIDALENIKCASIKDLYYKWNENRCISEIISINSTRKRIIPKTIHWCWFGGNPLSDREQKCIDSWHKYCRDYEIVKWDENNFDINVCDYVSEAYRLKKFAFVSDFFRLWVLFNYGGIYMDSDVEVTNNLDAFLCHNAFSGYEDNIRIPTGIMGGEKGSKYIKYLLDYYKNRHFEQGGVMDMTTNVVTISRMTYEKYKYNCTGDYFEIKGEFAMYPREVFCPINVADRTMNKTDNTYAIHHFAGSWI